MKASFKPLLAIAFCFTTMAVFTAKADNGARITQEVLGTVRTLENKDKTIACVMIDQLTSDSQSRTFTRYLYSGNDYIAVAEGDHRIDDTDLVVYRKVNGDWVEVAKDADSSNTAVVGFHCNQSGDYKFSVKAYRFKSGYSTAYYGLTLAF